MTTGNKIKFIRQLLRIPTTNLTEIKSLVSERKYEKEGRHAPPTPHPTSNPSGLRSLEVLT